MSRDAFIVGGTGQIGRAVAGDLLEHGWRVIDALIDTIAFHADHGRQLIEVQQNVGTFIVISSSSVYRDTLGKTLDEASQNGFPDLPVPIPETQPTVDPGPATYSTRKIALERTLLAD